MTILEYNPKIRSKTTYLVPIYFGDKKHSQKKFFSYTIFVNKLAKEIRFDTKKVLIYKFGEDNFLSELREYTSENELERKIRFELISKEDGNIKFKDWTIENGDGNHCNFEFDDVNKTWKFSFHRVNSFLGYQISGEISLNKMGDFKEETYFQFDNLKKGKELKWDLVNEYEYFNNKLDEIANYILENGWSLPNEMKEYLK